MQGTGEVGHDHDRTLEDADEEDVLVLVVFIDGGGQFNESCGYLLFRNEYFFDVIAEIVDVHECRFSSEAGP